MTVPTIEPMLAAYGAPTGPLDNWVAEPKLDGWRALVAVTDGVVSVTSRRGRDLAVPELAPLADLGVDVVLDGELIAGAGRMEDFYAVTPALARRRRPAALTFAAFDVLAVAGTGTVDLPYEHRRRLLEALELPRPAHVVPAWRGSEASDLLAACEAHGVEGLVLKRRDAPYVPGRRSTAWRKVKCATWRLEHADRRRPRR